MAFNSLLMNVLMRVHAEAQIGFYWCLSTCLMGNYELVRSLIALQALQDIFICYEQNRNVQTCKKMWTPRER